MKYWFIVNPAAGKGKFAPKLCKMIHAYSDQNRMEYEIRCTTRRGDAAEIAREICEKYPEEKVIFACGGDGIVCEVVSGIFGYPHVTLGVIPAGTGNDFVRSFTDPSKFTDLASQMRGHETEVDVIQYNDKYSINVLNIGFDCQVVASAAKMKKIPLVQAGFAYILGVVATLIRKPGLSFELSVDGGEWMHRDSLLFLLANGRYYGGGFCPAPIADMQDGYMDLCIARNISRRAFVSLVGYYRKGKHLETPKLASIIEYRKCRTVDVRFRESTDVCGDGEIAPEQELHVSIHPHVIRLHLPEGCEPLHTAAEDHASESSREAEADAGVACGANEK